MFLWIAAACVTLSIAAIGVAEAFMPDNIHGRLAVLTFYQSFGPMALFWAIGAASALWYLRFLNSRER